MTPFTLHEDDDAKVVQLSGDYSTSWGCSINELKAVFYASSGQIELHRFKNNDDAEVTRFDLSQAEAAAFFEAHETFKAKQVLKKLVEEKRIAAVILEAHKLVEGLPVEIIEEPESDAQNSEWRITSETINAIRYHAYNADQLLERAKLAVKDCTRYQTEQAIHDEIAAIKKACPAIKVRNNHAPWHVAIESPDLYGEYASTPEEMLERVKAAKAKYEEWQAEQERVKKVLLEVERLTEECPAVTTEQETDPIAEKTIWYIRLLDGPIEVAHTADELLLKVHQATKQFIEQENELIKQND